MNPRLVVVSGPEQGASYTIADDPFTIGQDERNHFVIADHSVSRDHCVIVRQGDGFLVRDLGSGTLVNDVSVREQRLTHRDYLTIGRTVLQFLTWEDVVFADAPAPAAVSLAADQNHFLASRGGAAGDLQALLRVSAMLHSFHALYEGRGSPVQRLFEQHLLALILDMIPANRGAIMLYEDSLEQPSSVAVKDHEGDLPRPATINRNLVKRVLTDNCGMLVEDTSRDVEGTAGSPQSLLLVPLTIRRQACGLIYLEGAGFREEHLELLVTIAQIASVAMENAFQLEWLEDENERLEGELYPDHHMIGNSEPLRELQRSIVRTAQTSSTVLILGETDTGKDLVARAIHHSGPRARKPFVAVNCAALSETLLESELFGHEKGAFTGAFCQKKGRLEVAEGGTVFLDEAGEIPLQVQVKLLRVLQERQMERVGGTQPIKLDIRLIAATNRNLEDEVRSGRFRQDLYYRLNVVTLMTPALRQRPGDIFSLAVHFAAKFGRQCGRRITGITPEAQAYLSHYDWPGNIRELENAIERAVVLGAGDMIQLEDLPESIREIARPRGLGPSIPLQDAIDDTKRKAITLAFEQARGDHTMAARALGVHPNYLYRLMRNLGMR